MRLLALFAVALLVSPLVAAPVPKSVKRERDEDRIVGAWVLDTIDTGWGEGRSRSPAGPFRMVLARSGGMSQTQWRLGMVVGTYRLDSDRDAKTLDITIDGRTALGLYDLDGDTLRICWSQFDGCYPAEFKAEREVASVITLKRVKDEKDK